MILYPSAWNCCRSKLVPENDVKHDDVLNEIIIFSIIIFSPVGSHIKGKGKTGNDLFFHGEIFSESWQSEPNLDFSYHYQTILLTGCLFGAESIGKW